MSEPLTVTKHTSTDGIETLTVDAWPRETVIDDILLKQADPAFMQQDGDTLTIRVSNGQAVYRLEADHLRLAHNAWLVSSRLSK